MKPRKKLIKNGSLEKHREAFIQYLLDMGYTKKSLENYDWTVRCLDQFMYECGQTNYSSDIGKAFLEVTAKTDPYAVSVQKSMKCVVRRFNCYMFHEKFAIVSPIIITKIPPQFDKELNNYLCYMRMRGLRKSTIMQRFNNLQKAMLKFNDFGVKSCSEIKPKIIYAAFEKTSNKQGFSDAIRGFLNYLFKTEVMQFDYSVFVPSYRKSKPVPSIYTSAETEKLLNSKDSNANTTKRNTAIILLALKLGMRSGDIANLKMSNVDIKNKIISFVQEKSQVPQNLELLPEIEEALLSYVLEARPTSDIPNIFLSLKSPVRTINRKTASDIVSLRLEKSGIDTGERKRGGHALRMTLASELVSEKVPYDVIRKILGHEDPNAIKHYVKFDIEALRSCSIEVPPVTGKLATHMKTKSGGGVQ